MVTGNTVYQNQVMGLYGDRGGVDGHHPADGGMSLPEPYPGLVNEAEDLPAGDKSAAFRHTRRAEWIRGNSARLQHFGIAGANSWTAPL